MILITDNYRQQNASEHERNPLYGSHGNRWADYVRGLANNIKAKSILDYGCGKGTLVEALKGFNDITIREYDPAIPGKDAEPVDADLVVCTDVLEHIEPDCLDDVLKHIFSKSNDAVFFCIAMRKGSKLPDGTHKHQIIRSPEWWTKKLSAHGQVRKVKALRSDEFACVVTRKRRRWDVIIALAKKNGWRRGAEVGVFRGECLSHLLHAGIKMIAVDLWADLPVDTREKNMKTGVTNYHKHPLAEYEENVRTLASFFGTQCRIIKADTVAAAHFVPDGSLDFVFIDACHETEAVKADIRAWAPKLKTGGYMIGHDRSWPSVQRALAEVAPNYKMGADSVWYLPKEKVKWKSL